MMSRTVGFCHTAASKRRHELGAQALGFLAAMIRNKEIAAHQVGEARRLVEEWEATFPQHLRNDPVQKG